MSHIILRVSAAVNSGLRTTDGAARFAKRAAFFIPVWAIIWIM